MASAILARGHWRVAKGWYPVLRPEIPACEYWDAAKQGGGVFSGLDEHSSLVFDKFKRLN
jgi:hypothetical protein